jgi:hypothetical protein
VQFADGKRPSRWQELKALLWFFKAIGFDRKATPQPTQEKRNDQGQA